MGHALALQVLSKHELQHSWELCTRNVYFRTKLFETALSDFSLARIKGTRQIIKR